MRLFSSLVKLLSVACFVSLGFLAQAWAEPEYSREQVEKHLRTMFHEVPQGLLDFPAKDFSQRQYLAGIEAFSFHAFAKVKPIRFTIFNLEDEELGMGWALKQELEAITRRSFKPIIPEPGNFDLGVFVFYDIATEPLHPEVKAYLQGADSDEEYSEKLLSIQKEAEAFKKQYGIWSGATLGYERVRIPAPLLVMAAFQRYVPYSGQGVPLSYQLRFVVFRALTNAQSSDVFEHSVMNLSSLSKMSDFVDDPQFFLIDRAVLRAIFAHEDWSGKDYETSIKLLIDRVMEQLHQLS